MSKSFTPDQLAVVQHRKGPLLVIAGAGTGKTHTITGRVLSLINDDGVSPESILALTFTEKAAEEMHTRIVTELPLGSSEPFIGTFHAFADHVVRSHGLDIGINPEFTLIKDADLLVFLRQHYDRFSFSYYRSRSQPYSLLATMSQYFGRLQDEAISPKMYADCIAELSEKATTDEEKEYVIKHGELAQLYETYMALLIEEGKMDYAGLTYHAREILMTRPSVAAHYAEKYKYVILDEYQDTNIVQNEMIDAIVKRNKSIMVVGDDDQAIYKWRGASLHNILSFKQNFPDATEIVLNDNYRSTQPILDCSYAVIQKNNPYRLEVQSGIDKKLKSRAFDEEKMFTQPEIHRFSHWNEEVNFVAEKAIRAIKKNQTVAILARTNALLKPFVEKFVNRDIEFETSTTIELISKPIVKDMIAFLRVVLNPWDDLSLYRLLTLAAFKVPMEELHEALKNARHDSLALYTFLNDEQWGGIKKVVSTTIEHARENPVSTIIGTFLETSGYLAYAQEHENAEELTELAQFSEFIREFEEKHTHKTVADLLEYIRLSEDVGSTDNGSQQRDSANNPIALMTIHGSKGLEFDVVFIVGAAQNKFPTINRSDALQIPESLIKEKARESSHIEEERRLFYVACTRAKQILTLTYSDFYDGSRKFKPSIFCEEARVSGTARVIDHSTGNMSSNDQLTLNLSSSSTSKKVSVLKSLSYSQLSTFQMCPKKYQYRYELGLGEPPSASLSFGVSLHNALKDFSLSLIDRAEKSPNAEYYTEEDKDYLRKMLEKNWINRGYGSKKEADENKQLGWECLEKFFYDEKKQGRVPYSVERSFSLKIEGVKVSGRIDRIDKLPDGTYEIIDYKTGKSSSYDVKKDMQLSVYALAARDSLKISVSRYSLIFLENGEWVTATRSEADIEKCIDSITAVSQEIALSEFGALPGFQCNFCPYRMICPEAL